VYVKFHQSSLLRAAGNGHTATVQLLLEAGADKEAVDRVRDTKKIVVGSHKR